MVITHKTVIYYMSVISVWTENALLTPREMFVVSIFYFFDLVLPLWIYAQCLCLTTSDSVFFFFFNFPCLLLGKEHHPFLANAVLLNRVQFWKHRVFCLDVFPWDCTHPCLAGNAGGEIPQEGRCSFQKPSAETPETILGKMS